MQAAEGGDMQAAGGRDVQAAEGGDMQAAEGVSVTGEETRGRPGGCTDALWGAGIQRTEMRGLDTWGHQYVVGDGVDGRGEGHPRRARQDGSVSQGHGETPHRISGLGAAQMHLFPVWGQRGASWCRPARLGGVGSRQLAPVSGPWRDGAGSARLCCLRTPPTGSGHVLLV